MAATSRPSRDAYDLAFGAEESVGVDTEGLAALRAFERASRGYLTSPLPWIGWGLVLPLAALGTLPAFRLGGTIWVLGLWTGAVLLGGAVEGAVLLRARRARGPSTVLGSWAMSVQGNLSLVALALSLALWFVEQVKLLPALWLLILGHSFFALGALSLRELRRAGLVYQIGGLLALLPGVPALETFAVVTLVGNFWVAFGVWRRDREERESAEFRRERVRERSGP